MAACYNSIKGIFFPPPKEFYDWPIWQPAREYRDFDETPRSSRGTSSTTSAISDQQLHESSESLSPPQAQVEVLQQIDAAQQSYRDFARGRPTITANEAAAFARQQGCAPTAADVLKLREETRDSVSWEQCKSWMVLLRQKQASDTVESMLTFFKFFDKNGSGRISRQQMINLMRNYGEPMTPGEVDQLLDSIGMKGDDQIDYEMFVQALLME